MKMVRVNGSKRLLNVPGREVYEVVVGEIPLPCPIPLLTRLSRAYLAWARERWGRHAHVFMMELNGYAAGVLVENDRALNQAQCHEVHELLKRETVVDALARLGNDA